MSATQIDIPTAESTPIAVWTTGEGPAIVLVHGSMCDHTTFDALAAELRGDFTTFRMDRRGFGASPDSGRYSAEREFADVALVVDAVSTRVGTDVILFGHSWGASCALAGAARSTNVSHLLLYEPSFGLEYPEGFIDRVEAQVAAGDAEGAVLSVLVDLAGMTDDQAADLRASPAWRDRLATAPTIAREARIEDGWVYRPGEFDTISAPTVFMVGSRSPSDMAEISRNLVTAVKDAQLHTLRDHGHFAYKTHPRAVAEAIREFVRRPR